MWVTGAAGVKGGSEMSHASPQEAKADSPDGASPRGAPCEPQASPVVPDGDGAGGNAERGNLSRSATKRAPPVAAEVLRERRASEVVQYGYRGRGL